MPEPLHCGLPKQAPLLPKLRGYFAEFLNNSSLAHLRILSSSTCVGLRYGHLHLPVSVCGTGTSVLVSGFSWQREISRFCSLASSSQLDLRCADLPAHQPHCLNTVNQRRARLILLRPHFTQTNLGGAGISTCCPSPTPFGLGLGPD